MGLPRCAQATSQMLGQHCASSAEQQPSVRLTDGHTMAWAVPIPYQCTSTNLALQRIWPWRSANQERRIIPPWVPPLFVVPRRLGMMADRAVMPCPSALVAQDRSQGHDSPKPWHLLARRHPKKQSVQASPPGAAGQDRRFRAGMIFDIDTSARFFF